MLEPGRERDALIAERVMGLAVEIMPDGRWECGNPIGLGGAFPLPCYSTDDDDAAWAVVREMWEREWDLAMEVHSRSDGDLYWISITSRLDGTGGCVAKPTFAHAVCAAALRALGVEV